MFFPDIIEYLRSQPENIIHLNKNNKIISFIAMVTVCSITSHECISSIVKYIYGIAEQSFVFSFIIFKKIRKESLIACLPNLILIEIQLIFFYFYFLAKFSLGLVSLACHSFIFSIRSCENRRNLSNLKLYENS